MSKTIPEKRTLKNEMALLGLALVTALTGVSSVLSLGFTILLFFGSMVQPKIIPFELALVALTVVLGFSCLRSSEWTIKRYKASRRN